MYKEILSPEEEPASLGSGSASINDSRSLRLFDVKALGEIGFEGGSGRLAEVVVIVPLYNYAQYVSECLWSVALQDIDGLSLIVIDDCSTDDGPSIVKSFMKATENRFSSVRLVRHCRNQGLSMARNSGIAWSTEPYLFMLDADNRLRHRALTRLLRALKVTSGAFAYSQLRIFGAEEQIGISGPWQPERIALGNYIDAMALITRSALLAANGYSVLADDHGWEDYDLWCRFAEMGLDGVFLPELLCEYRVHHASMLRTRTNLNSIPLMLEMAIRHPAIFCKWMKRLRVYDS